MNVKLIKIVVKKLYKYYGQENKYGNRVNHKNYKLYQKKKLSIFNIKVMEIIFYKNRLLA